MILAYSKFGISLEIAEDSVISLTVEDPGCFAEMVRDIYIQAKGGDGAFLLSERDKALKIDKNIEVVINPFGIDFNDRKIQNRLYDKLKVVSTEFDNLLSDVDSAAVRLLYAITEQIPYNNISFDLHTDIGGFLKLYHVQIDSSSYSNLIELLCEYIKVLSGLTGVTILCLVDLKKYFSLSDMEMICKQANYNKISIVFIQSSEAYRVKNEKKYILDKDLCFIS